MAVGNSNKIASKTRIVLAEETGFVAERLKNYLEERGFQVRLAETGAKALELVRSFKPDFVLYDMMLSDYHAIAFLKAMKQENLLGDERSFAGRARVFVLSSHNSKFNVRECLKAGAIDYLVKPVKPDDVLARLILHLQAKRQVAESSESDQSEIGQAMYYMHLTELLMREGLKLAPQPEALYNLVGMLSLVTNAVRVSVIEAQIAEVAGTPSKGRVRASNDKRDIDGLVIDLEKYPEVIFVLRSEKTLAMDNLKGDPTMSAIAKLNKSISFNAIVVCPIRIGHEIWGVISVRLPESKTSLSDFEIRFAQLTALVVGSVIARQPTFMRAAS